MIRGAAPFWAVLLYHSKNDNTAGCGRSIAAVSREFG